jgi:hypothetical protein
LNETDLTALLWSSKECSKRPVSVSQMRTVPLSSPQQSFVPSGLYHRHTHQGERTQSMDMPNLLLPSVDSTFSPPAMFHTLTAPLEVVAATCRPSGSSLHVHACTTHYELHQPWFAGSWLQVRLQAHALQIVDAQMVVHRRARQHYPRVTSQAHCLRVPSRLMSTLLTAKRGSLNSCSRSNESASLHAIYALWHVSLPASDHLVGPTRRHNILRIVPRACPNAVLMHYSCLVLFLILTDWSIRA